MIEVNDVRATRRLLPEASDLLIGEQFEASGTILSTSSSIGVCLSYVILEPRE